MRMLFSGLVVISYATLPGCATITSEEMQAVTLTTKDKEGETVADASCTLKNDKGSWDATAPSNTRIHRSSDDLLVECKKEGHPDGFLRAISRAAAGMWGNIIFGGGIGAIIDHSKGTGYDYPNTLPVVMGETVVVDRKDEQPAPEDAENTEQAESADPAVPREKQQTVKADDQQG